MKLISKTTDLSEEDRALVTQQVILCNEDEGDIDNHEFWSDAEEGDVDDDINEMNPNEQCDPIGIVNSDAQATEEENFHWSRSVVALVSIMIAKWWHKYNITQGALNSLLKLLGLFLSVLSLFSSSLSFVSSLFPLSIHKLKSSLHIEENNFVKYVVCPSCHFLYRLEECFDVVGSCKTPKLCSYIAFPQHPHRSRRLPCGERLLSEITLKSGNKKYYPRKYYCYKPIIDSLRSLVKRKGFLNACELWRLRSVPQNTLCDIYDGQVWKDFQFVSGTPFLAAPHNLGLMLNIDWFTPFKHSPYSVGAIYMVITNLPRSERFKKRMYF